VQLNWMPHFAFLVLRADAVGRGIVVIMLPTPRLCSHNTSLAVEAYGNQVCPSCLWEKKGNKSGEMELLKNMSIYLHRHDIKAEFKPSLPSAGSMKLFRTRESRAANHGPTIFTTKCARLNQRKNVNAHSDRPRHIEKR